MKTGRTERVQCDPGKVGLIQGSKAPPGAYVTLRLWRKSLNVM